MTEAAIAERLDALTQAVILMAKNQGTRLTRAQMCERLGVCSKTLTNRMRAGDIPTPGTDGRWLLEEVLAWESRR